MSKIMFLSLIIISLSATAKTRNHHSLPEPREVTTTDELKPHVGLILGVTNPEGNYNSSGVLGIDIGYQPLIPFGLGLELTHTKLDYKANGSEFDRTNALLKMSYNLGGDLSFIKHSYVGLGIGASFTNNDTTLVGAPILGFDIPLKDQTKNYISLGANVRYELYSANDPNSFTLAGVIKYWY